MQKSIFRTRIVGVPFRVTQATSGTGGLTTVESQTSSSAASSVALDPFTIGGRLLLLGNNFQYYRVVRGRLTYVPDGSSNGLPEIVSGATAAPTYAARPFAIGIFDDPALSTITYNSILDGGGRYGNTTKGKTMSIGPSDWLWTSTTGASPTTIDLRMTSFGKLYFAFFNASTTATVSFGHLIIQLDVEFKGVIYNAAALGSAMAPPGISDTDPEEKKVSCGTAAQTLATSPRSTAAQTLIALGPSTSSNPAVPSGFGKGWF
jgi:hypothetical protein